MRIRRVIFSNRAKVGLAKREDENSGAWKERLTARGLWEAMTLPRVMSIAAKSVVVPLRL